MPNELCTFETLTKLLYCSEESTMFSLQGTAASPIKSSYLQ